MTIETKLTEIRLYSNEQLCGLIDVTAIVTWVPVLEFFKVRISWEETRNIKERGRTIRSADISKVKHEIARTAHALLFIESRS